MERFPIHEVAAAGDIEALNRLLLRAGGAAAAEIERFDGEGYTALMRAVISAAANRVVVRRLIEAGASIHRGAAVNYGRPADALRLALAAGDPAKVEEIVGAGADLHYSHEGYTALIDAVHGRNVFADARLLELLKYLISKNVELNSETKHRETGLRVLSHVGRFDAVKLLLECGADESQLAWNPLLRAIAIGSPRDVKVLVAAGAELEARDWWERTAFLLAVNAGNMDAAIMLADAGADIRAVGRCGKPALFYAIRTHNQQMLDWLLAGGADPNATDDFGDTVLVHASECSFAGAIDQLLTAGVDINAHSGTYTALASARNPGIAMRLLQAGADPAELSDEARRALVGLPEEPSTSLLTNSVQEFRRAANRRFGTRNPEEIDEPFWIAMIKAGVGAWHASKLFKEVSVDSPVWCAARFGQTISFLADGRVIQVAGEHEDGYDPDFCIYNDVFVHDRGSIRVFGYPEEVFPPTDFHTATLVDDRLLLIGSLGYVGKRRYGRTPVFSLDVATFEIRPLHPMGPNPGWIYKHRAVLQPNGEIVISGGKIAIETDGEEQHIENDKRYALDPAKLIWRRL
ncbi:MAG TPA: ankyrin repeat domain-containing protein [Steroidobacteraceae bacterium]|nr:ankyrin repeat domain-containing protein [Steroidobacteraceae bacterium]